MAALDAFRGRIGTMWRPYRLSRDIFDGQIAGVPPHRAVHRGHMAPNTPLGDPPGGFGSPRGVSGACAHSLATLLGSISAILAS